MKRLLLFIGILAMGTGIAKAQSPEMFNYQAVARNDQGELLTNQSVGVQISILQGSASGSVVYSEQHNVTTDAQGLVNMMIGDGSTTNGNFSDIDWSDGPYFIRVGMDPAGGSSYTTMGTTQLVSVPYAQYADSTASAFSGDYADLMNKPVDVDGVATDNIKDQAITESKIDRLAVTTQKIDYMAIDSSRLDPTALEKWLRPTLQWDHTYAYVGINREFGITSSSSFGVSSDGDADTYGGMYVNTDDPEGWPFYGYAAGGNSQAWHHYDHGDKRWRLVFDWATPITRLLVNESGVMPGGNGDLMLGSSSHRWSEIHATNGTILTSDRRLKKDIEPLAYGLKEIMQLEPITFQWKDQVSSNNAGNKKHLGLVAQQVEQVMNELVDQPSKDSAYLGMSYSEIIPVLVQAIQQQQKIIEEQRRSLNNKNQKLQAQIDLIRDQLEKMARNSEDKTNQLSGISDE